MFILANFIQILIIGKMNNKLSIKNGLISLIPFAFLIFLSFFELTYTYRIAVYYLALLMGLFHLLENKNGVIRQSVIIMFINYTVSFIFMGVDHLSILLTIPDLNLNYLLLSVISFSSWYLLFRMMIFFSFSLDESSSILELLFNVITVIFSVFLAFILDTKDSTIFSIYSDILYYLIFLSYILIFLVGRLGIYVYRTIIERENVLQNNIEFQKNKLDFLKSGFDEKTIKLLYDLVGEGNYGKALEVTSRHFDFENKTKESMKKIDLLNNELISTFLKSKFSTVSDLSLRIDINDSLFDVDFQTYSYFFEILGIVLDNAIEAAHKTMEKQFELEINRPDISTTEFVIRNSANEDSKKNLQEKTTQRGVVNRMNGLRILDILVQRSEIVVITNVDDMVTTRVILS